MEKLKRGDRLDGKPLAGLLETLGSGGDPLVVRFPEPLARHSLELLGVLGAIVEIHPDAPELSPIKASGKSRKTRRQLGEESRRRMREAYFARPDKKRYSPSSGRD